MVQQEEPEEKIGYWLCRLLKEKKSIQETQHQHLVQQCH